MAEERILVVDDEPGIREIIREYFAPEGFVVDQAADGVEALKLFEKSRYSLVILDIMMPKVDGWTVCREIRKTSQVPIIMLSARGEEYDKLFGFELGVDDYMVKPFSPRELMARSRAVIRRSQSAQERDAGKNKAVFEGLEINFVSRNVTVNGEPVALTPKEYELLSFFSKNPGRVFSRQQLLSRVWGYDFYGDVRTVDTHVKMLRESLGEYRGYIVTVWGTGYKFEVGDAK
ncbi:MAG: response regulator transcription factor [Clostridia bacterium]|nr:response regulator transcription factor [Clostridiales bacterium]